MATETKDAFESMNLSTEQLALALETAKSSDEHQLNERELSQIEDMLSKLRSMFSESSKVITQPRAERGDVQSQKELLDQVTNQYQAMNALVANMTQTLIGLDGVRDKFNQVFGGVEGLMANAQKAQQMPGASQIQLQGMFDKTKTTLDQCTESFKSQLMEQMALYEAIGAEYFQMQAAMKFIPNVPHTPPATGDGDGDNPEENTENNGNNTENTEISENAGNTSQAQSAGVSDENYTGNPDDLPVSGPDNELLFAPPPVAATATGSEQPGTATGSSVPVGIGVPSGSAPMGGTTAAPAGGEQQGAAIGGGSHMGGGAAAAPAGGEQQGTAMGGGAPMGSGGATAAPAGGEQQGTVVTGGAPMGGGSAAAPAASAPAAPDHQSSTSAHATQAQHSAMQQTEQADRGRKDERQKKSKKKKT